MKNRTPEKKENGIGKRIHDYRKMKGITQKQLADSLHVSNGRISNWEQGINRPDADKLAEICRVLEVSPSALLGVKLSENELADIKERRVIKAYRRKQDMQKAVDILLGLEKN